MFYTRESARYIPALEAKLAADPRSPVFARLASYLLAEGKIEPAIELCVEGLKRFPEYPAGHLVLGKAYEAQARHVEAMLEYRKVLRAVPDNPAVGALLRNVEQRGQEEFRAFAEERARRLKERRNTFTFEKYVAEEPSPGGATVDFLLERLRNVRTAVAPAAVPREEPAAEEHHTEPQPTPTIVTATLAEIYASQGQYREAIEAYRKLRDQHPSEAERYDKRISQLVEMTKLQHADQKG